MIKLTPLTRDVSAGDNDPAYLISRLTPIKTVTIDEFSRFICRPVTVDGRLIPAYNSGLGKWCLAEFAP